LTPAQAAFVDKARRSLEAAGLLMDRGHYDFAASRAYYAMFYLAEALLLERGMEFAKHSAVLSAFGREFAKTGLFPTEHHQHLCQAEASRIISDYDAMEHVGEAAAREQFDHAAQFLAAAELYLQTGLTPDRSP
jgi:uncharacterized protein (UPF0332 family)